MKKAVLLFICIVFLVACTQQKETKEKSGLFPVNENGKHGYIDKAGKYVINPQFDAASAFLQGLAAVKIGDKWGYIDKAGKYVINPQFDQTGLFAEGLAAVNIGAIKGKYGFLVGGKVTG